MADPRHAARRGPRLSPRPVRRRRRWDLRHAGRRRHLAALRRRHRQGPRRARAKAADGHGRGETQLHRHRARHFRSVELCKGYWPCRGGACPRAGSRASRAGRTGWSRAALCHGRMRRLVEGRLRAACMSPADHGDSWQSCMHGGLNVQTKRKDEWAQGDSPSTASSARPAMTRCGSTCYCAGTSYWPPNHSTVYRSDDGGKTWTAVLFSDPRFARQNLYNVEDDYVSRQWRQREQVRPTAWWSAAQSRRGDHVHQRLAAADR